MSESPTKRKTHQSEDPNQQRPTTPGMDQSMGKKGFLSGLFGKKRPPTGAGGEGVELTIKGTKSDENFNKDVKKPKMKQKYLNRKNLADGRIRLNAHPQDVVAEDYNVDYKDNPFDILEQNPLRTTSYVENLRGRTFSQIYNKAVKNILESQQQELKAQPVENIELDFIDLIYTFKGFLSKCYIFFQGLLTGITIVHLILLFNGESVTDVQNNYSESAIRVNQIFYIFALISTIGAIDGYRDAKKKFQETVRTQAINKEEVHKRLSRFRGASICYFVVYAINVFNHTFVSKISSVAGSITGDSLTNEFNIFRVLNAIQVGFALIGWYFIITIQDLSKDYVIGGEDYSVLTGDETLNDDE